MRFRQNKALLGKVSLLLLMVMLLAIVGGLTGLGCIKGLQPIGWSGGVMADDTLFVGSKEGKLVAIDLVNGSRQWSDELKMPAQGGGLGCAAPAAGGGCAGGAAGMAIYGTPAVADGLVYIGGYNGRIYAFNASSLEIGWVYPREGNLQPIVGGSVVAQDTVYIGVAEKKNLWKLYALDAATGNVKWQFETGDKIWATPAVSGDTVYIGSFDKKLYALSATDGSKEWEFEAEGAIAATPLVYNGMVYIGSFDRHFYALDAASGSLRWKFMGENWFWAKPVVYDNVIYAPCLDGKVYALDAESGNKLAEFDLGSPVSASPVIVNSSVVFASQKGLVYALDAGSDKMRYLVDIEKEVYGPLSASGGVVYIHTQDLTIHAVDVISGAKLKTISLKSGE